MRTAFGLSIIVALAQASTEGRITAELTNQNGFDLRGFKATKNLDIQKEQNSMFRPNIDAYLSESKLQTKLQKMIDSTKVDARRASKKRNKKTLREGPQINLKNLYENKVYTGPLYFGSQQEGVQVVYDTGSDWLTVESAQCRSCFGENFNEKKSESWKPADHSKIEEVEYLSGTIEGVTGTDKVCLSNDQNCANDFEFFLIDYNQLLPPDMDGVLGMCARGKVDDHENGPDYVDALKAADVITDTTFSFSLSKENEQSYVDFGSPRNAAMSDPDDLKYLQLEDHFFWLGKFAGVRFGEEDSHAYAFEEAVEVVYDSGSGMSLVPETMARGFFQKLVADHEFVQFMDVFLVNCSLEGWPNVYMLTGDNFWVEYSPEDYIMPVPDMPDDQADGLCMLGFMAFEHDFFLAGNNFLRGYYSVHKRDSFQLGLVPHSSSSKSPVTEGEKPKQILVSEIIYANLLQNIALTWFGMVMWWVFIEGKVPDLADSSLQSTRNPLRAKKTVKKSDKKELEETIAKLQAQLAAKEGANTME